MVGLIQVQYTENTRYNNTKFQGISGCVQLVLLSKMENILL